MKETNSSWQNYFINSLIHCDHLLRCADIELLEFIGEKLQQKRKETETHCVSSSRAQVPVALHALSATFTCFMQSIRIIVGLSSISNLFAAKRAAHKSAPENAYLVGLACHLPCTQMATGERQCAQGNSRSNGKTDLKLQFLLNRVIILSIDRCEPFKEINMYLYVCVCVRV